MTQFSEEHTNGNVPRLHAVAAEADYGVDPVAAERAAGDLLAALGADLDDESLTGTPRRIARLYAELLTPAPFNPTTFPNDELVVARGIPFHSLCEHHLLPFVGVAHVGYLPGEHCRLAPAPCGRPASCGDGSAPRT